MNLKAYRKDGFGGWCAIADVLNGLQRSYRLFNINNPSHNMDYSITW